MRAGMPRCAFLDIGRSFIRRDVFETWQILHFPMSPPNEIPLSLGEQPAPLGLSLGEMRISLGELRLSPNEIRVSPNETSGDGQRVRLSPHEYGFA